MSPRPPLVQRRSWPRPAGATRPFLVLAVMSAVVFVIGRATGSTWLALASSGLLATLFLSAVLPALALSGARLQVRAPADATVGRPVGVDVEVAGRLWDARLRFCDPPGEWVRVEGRGRGTVALVPRRRGVVEQVHLELRSAAPLGLVWWRLSIGRRLAQPLEIGPAPLPAVDPQATAGAEGAPGSAVASRTGMPELVRTLREYVPGDQLRSVSWPATARHGRLLVKDMEGEGADRVTLVVDLQGDPDAAEDTASRAAGMALAALARGLTVVLATAERDGGRIGTVATGRDVGRRLARAVGHAAPPVPSPAGPGDVVRMAAR